MVNVIVVNCVFSTGISFFFSVMGSKKMGKGSLILALGNKEGVPEVLNLKELASTALKEFYWLFG